ncbi:MULTISPECIES: 2-amino-4-hydroxy-6-hydroxymethyldihydropteridine diphosphokinase [Clostridia]|uniref:2-amino-4-hydroxy-6- hydroxymethyldihydropteridine diphosphokinase n=1 Tax=Clostridia TaxID=186801 RepID=UPI000EA04B49|nr:MULTISPECIES: 2-amino-4-hydroxy-6-hydroxymethyldihydropteridine diphosphokinase [Clostridia]NBJ71272.1 2-amino-4-hydroxy-6-hydroxymethyldihydropteridine diphosphokinase [Roseburia sp. 1XD42-34]RKI74899.1 2-amino-4-hydroxy-6-hydroxymethyldihydropteridine diphosphokinase [Clostridium sp. 1xD42-85]
MNQVYIALGTNIEPREKFLKEGLHGLQDHEKINVIKTSSIYQTAPVGYTKQADFLNMVIEVETTCSPLELLDYCQQIESELGRKRTIRFGPRTLDLDILLYNQENIEMERLTIPHPRMHERAFVLVPLNEIAPHIILPLSDGEKDVTGAMKELSGKDLKDVEIWTKKESEDD